MHLLRWGSSFLGSLVKIGSSVSENLVGQAHSEKKKKKKRKRNNNNNNNKKRSKNNKSPKLLFGRDLTYIGNRQRDFHKTWHIY
jgi:hypothetical protein